MTQRFFELEVHPQMIKADEVRPFHRPHFKANVDGELWHYRITKHRNCSKNDKSWFGRGSTFAHYHAKNSGYNVRFAPIGKATRKRKKISDKQLPLL